MDKLKEGSSWAGLALFAQSALAITPPPYQWVIHGLTAVFGALAWRFK